MLAVLRAFQYSPCTNTLPSGEISVQAVPDHVYQSLVAGGRFSPVGLDSVSPTIVIKNAQVRIIDGISTLNEILKYGTED